MPSSFINERSAEMILVPNIINALVVHHFKVTPIYYWVSREGGSLSRGCFADTEVKVLALYARRPKVDYTGMNRLFVKLNEMLFVKAEIYRSKGIFAFAGVPLADSLDSLLLSVPCVYFSIANGGNEDLIEIHLSEERNPTKVLPYQLSINEIVANVERLPKLEWKQALKLISEMRSHDYRGF